MQPPKGSTFVRPSGSLDSRYVIVGEQPGRMEVRTGEVFCGPAGKELDKELLGADMPRMDSYLTNVIKDGDKYKDSYIQLYKGTRLLPNPIVTQRGREHLEFLKWELSQTQSQAFIAMGAVSLFALTGMTGITKWRGSLLDCTLIPGRKVIPTFHPATVIPPKNNYLNRRLIIFDLRKARDFIEDLYIPTYREASIAPTFHEALTFLLYIRDKGLNGNRISYDIEVHMERKEMHVSCISFATNLQAMSIPFTKGVRDYFTTKQEMQIMLIIADILEDPSIRKVAQNAVFDGHFLLRRYGIKVRNVDDTMVAQQIIMPDYPKGLDFITSIWTDHPYYKDEGKNFIFQGTSIERGWQYNATDSNICDEAMPKQLEQVVAQKNELTYERQRRMIEPCVYMMERGIKADVVEMEKLHTQLVHDIDTTHDELCRIAGRDLPKTFAKSTKQLTEYFFHDKGIKPYKKRKGAKWVNTYDDLAMKRLSRRGFKEAKLILEIRKMTKLKSTYLDIGKIDEDGRSRCSYNPVGTRYSRMASSKNIFGSGGNHQNWPHHLQKFLKPDDGYVYYPIDLSQAENRIVAYVGGISEMMHAFETESDVHALTAGLIFGKHPDDVTREDGTCPIGDGTHSERFWGKKANHGFNYGWSFKDFALKNEIRENEGKLIYQGYHSKYPGVQRNFQQGIIDQLNKNRTLTNLMGRKTMFFGDIHGPGKVKNFQEAFSCIPQGTVGDMINELGIEYIYYNTAKFKDVELLRQVHDEIGFQIPLSVSWLDHATMLLDIKSNLEKVLVTDIGTEFVIPADISMGTNLNKEDCTELKKEKFSSNPEKFAHILEKTWTDLCQKEN